MNPSSAILSLGLLLPVTMAGHAGVGVEDAIVVAPTFVAKDPKLAARARLAWDAGVACTGTSPPAHAEVALSAGGTYGGADGCAFKDSEGLYRIAVTAEGWGDPRTLAHEVAHAWTFRSPPALTEGIADLIADCMVRREPTLGLPRQDDGRPIPLSEDLLTWQNESSSDREVRLQTYLASARLVRAAARLVPIQQLAIPWVSFDWELFFISVEGEGDSTGRFRSAVTGGVEAQRRALQDDDHDGLVRLEEEILGTDPDRWDSDGDGWWDGATLVPNAIPLPPDGTSVCLGSADAGTRVHLTVEGGTSERFTPGSQPLVFRDLHEGVQVGTPQEVTGPTVFTAILPPGRVGEAGGMWVRVVGDPLSPGRCLSTSDRTIVVLATSRGVPLDDLDRAMEAAETRLPEALRPRPGSQRRVVVFTGFEKSHSVPTMRYPFASSNVVRLDDGAVNASLTVGGTMLLGALAVARQVVAGGGGESVTNDLVEALARDLVDDPPRDLIISIDDDAVTAWAAARDRCSTGWAGVISGTCADPPDRGSPRSPP